ncbi:TPA: hypothetical protein QDC55_000813 [Burkholderia cenocepacia]|uniref:hypothetical protein n=1 Tax=Burkholderia cenocepacia TaxID=95486 RepID=UPI0012AECEA1|nr:hypothetical protein [Burkholderia cenocepacia]HDR9812230.1 hypothetical protein [Burkholderia cenocepacia]HDR9827299.1 hypothetical protein [Burkholderia cenocepacia]
MRPDVRRTGFSIAHGGAGGLTRIKQPRACGNGDPVRHRPIRPLMQINGPQERDSIMATDTANDATTQTCRGEMTEPLPGRPS